MASETDFDPSQITSDHDLNPTKSQHISACKVCNRQNESFHLNYGAETCFSCRAFFRRQIQQASSHKLKCKGNEECQLVSNSQKKCRLCRFKRCLAIGMKPECVLKEDDKKTRFRKHISKQLEEEQEINLHGDPYNRNTINPQDLPGNESSKIELKFKRKNTSASAATSPKLMCTRVQQVTFKTSSVQNNEKHFGGLLETTARLSSQQGSESLLVQNYPFSVERTAPVSSSPSLEPHAWSQHQNSPELRGFGHNNNLHFHDFGLQCPPTSLPLCQPELSVSVNPNASEAQKQIPHRSGFFIDHHSAIESESRNQHFPGQYQGQASKSVLDSDTSYPRSNQVAKDQKGPSLVLKDKYGRFPTEGFSSPQQTTPVLEGSQSRMGFHELTCAGHNLGGTHERNTTKHWPKLLVSSHYDSPQKGPDNFLTNGNESSTHRGRHLSGVRSLAVQKLPIEHGHQRYHSTQCKQPIADISLKKTNKFPALDVENCYPLAKYSLPLGINYFPIERLQSSSQSVSPGVHKLMKKQPGTFLELPEEPLPDGHLMPPPPPPRPSMQKATHDTDAPGIFQTIYEGRERKTQINAISTSTASEAVSEKEMVPFLLCLSRNPGLSALKASSKAKFEHFIKTWCASVQQIHFKPELVAGIINMHRDRDPICKALLMDYVVSLSKLLKDFAIQQPEFGNLPLNQQKPILLRGAQRLTQYFIGQYFASDNGKSQIQWLTAFHHFQQFDGNELPYLSLEEFNKMVGLFSPGLKYSFYLRQVHEFRSWKIPPWLNGLIAAVCLFHSNGHSSAFCEEDLELFVKAALPKIYSTTGVFCQDLTRICETMFDVFEGHLDATAIDSPTLTSVLSEVLVSFSESEEVWLNKRLAIFEDAFSSVNFGPELVRECIMHSLSVPLSKRFVSCTTVIFAERLKRALLLIPEFKHIPAQDQIQMLQVNIMPAVAVYVSRLVTFRNGEEQLRLLFGQKDRDTYASEFESILKGKLSMITEKSLNHGGQIMPKSEWIKYAKTSKNIGTFIDGGNRFQELMMLQLLNNEAVRNSEIAVLGQRFNTALHRKYANKLRRVSKDCDEGEEKGDASVLPPSWAKILMDVKYVSETAFKYIVLPEIIRREKEVAMKTECPAKEVIEGKENKDEDEED